MESTPLGTNMTNRKTSPIDLILVGTKIPDPTPLTQQTEFPEQNNVPGEPDPEPSLSDSSSNKSNSSKDINYSKTIKKKSNKKKKRRINKEQDSMYHASF